MWSCCVLVFSTCANRKYEFCVFIVYSERLTKMYLMYYLDSKGNRIYTLKVRQWSAVISLAKSCEIGHCVVDNSCKFGSPGSVFLLKHFAHIHNSVPLGLGPVTQPPALPSEWTTRDKTSVKNACHAKRQSSQRQKRAALLEPAT